MDGKKGTILRIEKTSIHDGDGLRTVVFLKGCPLRCQWCSTPESQDIICSSEYGKIMTAEEVIKEVAKDEIFFFHSAGGVTLSGGEVLMQAEFAKEILKGCCKRGIHTTIETSLFANYEDIELVLPYVMDLYADIKCIDGNEHKVLTGVDNNKILENLKKIEASDHAVNIRIRMPLIPTVNMEDAYMEQTGEFLSSFNKVTEVELLPYHRLGVGTYEKLKRCYMLPEIEPPKEEELLHCAQVIKSKVSKIPVRFLEHII